MARNFLTGLNLSKNELLNARIQNLSSSTPPTNPVSGQIYFATDLGQLAVWNGTMWTVLATGETVTEAITNAIDLLTTNEIEEGSNNLYFTTQRAIDAVGGSAASTNTPNTVVKRDASGNFAAGEITAGSIVLNGADLAGLISTASSDAITASNSYTDGEITTALGTSQGYADTAEDNANTYTDNLIGDLTVDGTAGDTVTDRIATAVDDHSDLTTGVHGVAGNVVGTSDTQTLTNKTLGSGTTLSADLDAGNQRITDLAEPTQASDAATKGYVDAVAEGLNVQDASVAATIGNIDLSTGGLLVVDGVQLVADDRVLVIEQTAPAENGIYLAKVGAWVRALDYNTAVEVQDGDFSFVSGGNLYGGTGWVQTAVVNVLGTDPVVFVQFSGAGVFTAGNGLELNGTEFDVVGTADRISVTANAVDIASTYVGQSTITTLGTVTTGTWEADTIAVEYGGTGATTAAGARSNLGATTKHAEGNPLLTAVSGVVSWTVTHNFATRDVQIQVYDTVSHDTVEVDVVRTSTNVVTLSWNSEDVSADSYRVVVVG